MNREDVWSEARRIAFRKGQAIARLGGTYDDAKSYEAPDEQQAFLDGFEHASIELSSAAVQKAWSAGHNPVSPNEHGKKQEEALRKDRSDDWPAVDSLKLSRDR